MEATYLRLFEAVRERLGLLHRDLKMLFSGLPLTCCCRGETRDRMGQAEDRPKHHWSSADQLAKQRVKPSSLRMLAEHYQALNHQREHQPRTRGVRLAATWQKRVLFIEDSECAIAIACISQLPKERSNAESLHRTPWLSAARFLGMR